jgi:PAS domain S-box-containing protein
MSAGLVFSIAATFVQLVVVAIALRFIRKARTQLEQRVRDRTAELAAANMILQQERYLLHTLMNYLPHNIYFKDAQSRFLCINQAMARYFGLRDPRDAIGKTDVDFFTDEHALQALADEQEIVRSGQGIRDKEEKETWPDGRATWASTTKLPLYDQQGCIIGTFGISQDITAQKRVAEALRAAKDAAEAASQAKSTFLANMSHEIRTPLNAVIGMTELVLKSQLTAQQREFLSTVRDSGDALLTVINDILDFSKIEAEKLVLASEQFHLRESLGDTMKSFAIPAHRQGLELVCHIHHDVPAWVVGDYHRLRQIVVNLINNAIKFTPRGEVVLEVARQIRSENQVRRENQVCSENDVELHFTVSDTGIGIPQEKHATIFDMFEQADSSTTRRHGGTGLGLAIASRLVGLMGGRIWMESEVGRGSRFHFTVHLGQADAASAAADSEPGCLHGIRVLVVDDNATNRRILDEVLSSWQMLPSSVDNAAQAIQQLSQAERVGQPFPLVITDAHMPAVDGFMLARQIGQDPSIDGPVIMMLTSGDRPSDMQQCERLGIAAYLLKPIKQSELLEAIELALGILGTRRAQPGQAAPRRSWDRSLRILLAEDSLVNQQLAVALLRGEGHAVTVANNGREAVAAAETGRFDLVLMDLQMPEMDGLEATAIIRANECNSGRRLPIIAMTAHALKGDRERCLAAGMDGYASKPIDAEELFAAIERQVFRTEAAAGGFPPPADRPLPPVETVTAGDFPAPLDPMVDWSVALKAVRGDVALLETIVETAMGEIPNLLAAVRRAAAAGDAGSLRLAAHTLKGSVRYFGAPRVVEPAQRLEAMGQNNHLQNADGVLSLLDQSAGQLMACLAEHRLTSNAGAAAETHEVTP